MTNNPKDNPINPIVQFNKATAEDLMVWGKKMPERKKVDLEPFLNDLQELVDTDRLDETPKLYEKYPKVRVGIRRALVVCKKRRDKELKEIDEQLERDRDLSKRIKATKWQPEGFWYSKDEPDLPMPVENSIDPELKQAFLSALQEIQKQAEQEHYMGWSDCRLCDKMNGSRELYFMGWKWPEGYIHYIQDHNVAPTKEFHDFVVGS